MSNKVYILFVIGMLAVVGISQQTHLRQGFGGQSGGEAVLQNNETKNSLQKISIKDYFEKIKIYFSCLEERITNSFSKKSAAAVAPAVQPASLYADPKASPY